jgi:diketogulonate reductase-like aldo/keto reductase
MAGSMLSLSNILNTIFKGLVRAIGVSNYTIHHLEELLKFAVDPPTLLQVKINCSTSSNRNNQS